MEIWGYAAVLVALIAVVWATRGAKVRAWKRRRLTLGADGVYTWTDDQGRPQRSPRAPTPVGHFDEGGRWVDDPGGGAG